jgi:hypothetical protein
VRNMWEELDFEEGIDTFLRLINTYKCMAQYVPMYNKKRLTEIKTHNAKGLSMRVFYRKTDHMEGATGFLDDQYDKDKLIIWADHTINVRNYEDLKKAFDEDCRLFVNYAKKHNKKILYARRITWKLYGAEWKSRIPNWKEAIEEIGKKYFKDFKVDMKEIMTFVVK